MDELAQIDRDYEAGVYAPGLLLVGFSGGGEAFALDTTASEMPVGMAPFIGMERDTALPVGADFRQFLETLYTATD